jgi:hypothetical protein
MQGQTIETKVTVDATDAIAQFAKFEHETKAAEKALRDADAATKAFQKSQADAVAAVTAIDQKIARYERDMMALGMAILSGSGNTKAYEVELRQLGRELDALTGKTVPAANKTREFSKAVNEVGVSGRGGGMAMLEFSRAFEDAQYGIGGVLNNIPGLLTALGVGAGLTGVASVAAVGISMLTKNFGGLDPAAKEASDAAKEHVKSLRDEISGLQRDLRALQVGAERASMEEQARAVMAAQAEFEKAVSPIGGAERFARLRDNEKLVGTIAVQMETAKQKASDLELEISKLAGMRRIQIEKDDQRRIDLAVDTANAITEIERKEAEKRSSAAKKEASKAKKETQPKFEFNIGQREMIDVVGLAAQKREDMLNDIAWQASQVRIGIAEQEAQSISGIVIGSLGGLDQIATGAVSTVASGLQQMTTDMLTGQEHIAERFGALVMQQAGQSLVSSGTKLAGEAVVSALTPGGQALAVTQAGAAAGLIATGIGLGGVAAGIEHMAAGGKIGKPIEKSGERDKGVAPRSSRDRGGGPLVINVSYGVGGPLPEDTAREIAKVQRQGARRGGA